MNNDTKTMRDALIEQIYLKMREDENIFFLTADFGAPALDRIRKNFKSRFVNVGIAEQNLVNVATGLAMEGFAVYAYAIAGFLSMRAYEQIRTNLAIHAQHKCLNVNLIGVGAGVSYDMSGPSHHCMEDLTIIRTLPNIVLFSPSDFTMAEKFTDYSLAVKKPKYIRLDGKAIRRIYPEQTEFDWEKGFFVLKEGHETCIISTGYMTHKALRVAQAAADKKKTVGVIDLFMLKTFDRESIAAKLKTYKRLITIEEGFKNKGGLDSLVLQIVNEHNISAEVKNFGFDDKYNFICQKREALYAQNSFADNDVSAMI